MTKLQFTAMATIILLAIGGLLLYTKHRLDALDKQMDWNHMELYDNIRECAKPDDLAARCRN